MGYLSTCPRQSEGVSTGVMRARASGGSLLVRGPILGDQSRVKC